MHNSFAIFLFLALAGAIEVVWLMAIIAHHKTEEPPVLRHLRRGALALVGLSFLWGVWFALKWEWEPWPPCLPVMAGVVLYLGLTIIAATRSSLPAEGVQATKWHGSYEGSGQPQETHVRAALGAMQARRAGLNGTSGPVASAMQSESSATVF